MNRTEVVIRSLVGATRRSIRPLSCAVDLIAGLLFMQGVPMDEIRVTKQVYPQVAKRLGIRVGAASRRVARLTSFCWDRGERARLEQIVGRCLRTCPPPRDMLVYLAVYTYLGRSFLDAVREMPDRFF